MRVLVTGGCGFVGRHFVKHYLKQGDDVVVFDDLSSGQPFTDPFLKGNKLIVFVDDVRRCFEMKAARQFDLIIHCAAVVGGRLKIEGDPLAVATDLAIDSDLFNWAVADKENLPNKVVYFSSSAVYPTMLQKLNQNCALSESFVNLHASRIGMPDQTYGWSKLTGELLAQQAVNKYGLDVAIYRPFSGYGEDQSEDYPFPSIIRRALNREDPFVVWGSGVQKRDFIHIDDVVNAVVASMDKLPPGGVLNLGTGIATSFIRLAEMAAAQVGYHPAFENDPSKPEGVFARVASTDEMHKYYKAKISLQEGVARAVDKARVAV